jgi:hypothetical protein
MAKDFLKPQPSKSEKMYLDMMVSLDVLDRRVWSTSSFVTAVAILSKTDPKKVAELLTTGQEKIKAYSKEINDEIDKIEEAEKGKGDGEPEGGHDHHGHAHES